MSEPATPETDFFVSYTAADRNWAEWISYVLEANGYKVVLQSWDFLPGGNFVLDMDRATRGSKRTIAVLSRGYCDSGFTQSEWAAAFSADPNGETGLLLPIRIEDFAPDGFFRAISYIDLVGLDEKESRKSLLEGVDARVKEQRRKPEQAPSFPGGIEEEEAPLFPGTLPSIWNLPLQLRYFAGRGTLLSSVGDLLACDRTCALFGLGGVGKSRLALEYAHRNAGSYEVVWRIRAHDEATARADLADLATALRISDPEKPRGERIEALRAELASRDRWLLIFDDAKGPEGLLPLIPPGRNGHVLVTSRASTGWQAIGGSIEIGPFTGTEATGFLSDRLGGADEGDVRQLCEALGNLPLAIEQAAGYMEVTGVAPAGYLERLRSRNPELLNQPHPVDYEHTVSTTWRLSMEAIKDHEEANRLLSFCAYLGADRIPRLLFDSSNPAAVDAGLAELRRFSLISLDHDTVSLHPLVQWVVRNSQSPDERRETVNQLKEILQGAWPEDSGFNPESWPACSALAPHLQSFAHLTLEIEHAVAWVAGEFLLVVGVYLRCRGDLPTASDVLAEAVEVLEGDEEGPEGLTIRALGERGTVLSYLNHHEQAVAIQNRALAKLEAGGARLDSGSAYQLAGITFCEAGDYERGGEMIEKGLEIFQGAEGADLHNIASAISNLGNVARLNGDLDRARELHIEGRLKMEEANGPEHPEVAVSLAALARVEKDLGDTSAARDSLQRALDIFEASLGPDSLEVGRVHHDHAVIDLEEEHFESAREHCAYGLENYRKTVGPDHPMVIHCLAIVAQASVKLGDMETAQSAAAEIARIKADE
jgi:tetratricopeptide (TPR) repeat protein